MEFVSVRIMRNKDDPVKSHKAIFKRKNGREKTINFGAEGAETYIDGASKQKRDAYIARHRVRENWTVPDNAGSLSRFIKWETPSYRENVKLFKKRFGL